LHHPDSDTWVSTEGEAREKWLYFLLLLSWMLLCSKPTKRAREVFKYGRCRRCYRSPFSSVYLIHFEFSGGAACVGAKNRRDESNFEWWWPMAERIFWHIIDVSRVSCWLGNGLLTNSGEHLLNFRWSWQSVHLSSSRGQPTPFDTTSTLPILLLCQSNNIWQYHPIEFQLGACPVRHFTKHYTWTALSIYTISQDDDDDAIKLSTLLLLFSCFLPILFPLYYTYYTQLLYC
jgi:hypothetical protein